MVELEFTKATIPNMMTIISSNFQYLEIRWKDIKDILRYLMT